MILNSELMYITGFKLSMMILLLFFVELQLPLLICFVADVFFIINDMQFRIPTILFAIAHAIYAWNMFSNSAYLVLQGSLILVMIIRKDIKVLLLLYAIILGANIVYASICAKREHVVGYWIFGASDALIYARDFHRNFPYSNYLVLIMYYGSQYCLN